MRTVQIKRDNLLNKDASQLVKTYYFSGTEQSYTVTGLNTLSVPDEVAIQWVADDSDMEVIAIT